MLAGPHWDHACTCFGWLLLNGHCQSDLQGRATYTTGVSRSVLDLVLIPREARGDLQVLSTPRADELSAQLGHRSVWVMLLGASAVVAASGGQGAAVSRRAPAVRLTTAEGTTFWEADWVTLHAVVVALLAANATPSTVEQALHVFEEGVLTHSVAAKGPPHTALDATL